jgi:hypothetical protein
MAVTVATKGGGREDEGVVAVIVDARTTSTVPLSNAIVWPDGFSHESPPEYNTVNAFPAMPDAVPVKVWVHVGVTLFPGKSIVSVSDVPDTVPEIVPVFAR